MRRLAIALFAVALAACTTVEHRDYGYYGSSSGGDYYYGSAYDTPWYDPYDSLFWGLRYSYYDPFLHPHFYYGVTYFPRYYGWGVGGSSWYAWRYWHPYSPYYGSYWDHYYDWWRYQRPHSRRDHLDQRMAGRRAGMPPGHGSNDPVRYGSARNAAERMARQRRMDGVMPIRERAGYAGAPAASVSSGTASGRAAGSSTLPARQRGHEQVDLPSRGYAPRERVRGGLSGQGGASDRFPVQERAWRSGGAVQSDSVRQRSQPAPVRPMRGQGLPQDMPPSRTYAPPVPASRSEGRIAPAPRAERPAPAMPPPRSSGREVRSPPPAQRERRER